jgi:Zn-finger protein
MSAGGICVSCEDCVLRHTEACADCLVTFVLERDTPAVVIDAAEARAVRLLNRAGLLPGLRHDRRVS